MTTQLRVSTSQDAIVRKEFRDFSQGEFLIAEDTGFLGIKIGENVHFLKDGQSVTSTICTRVSEKKVYIIPRIVEITATR